MAILISRPINKTSSKLKKLKKKQQQEFVLLLSDLLDNGFTTQESLVFMGKILQSYRKPISLISKNLAKGIPFYKSFIALGFTPEQVSQLHFASIHGDLAQTLKMMGQQMQEMQQKRQNLVKILFYPCILLCFLLMMLMVMKHYLLPQLGDMQGSMPKENWAIHFINQAPQVFLIVIVGGMVVYSFLFFIFRKKSALVRACWLVRVPLIGLIYRYYYTSFFAQEWGKLLQQGLEMKQIFIIMQTEGNTPLMQEMAIVLQGKLKKGIPIRKQINQWPFLLEGLAIIMQQGEQKGKLGDELLVYGKKIWEQLLQKIDMWLRLLQPLVFLVIAILIICVYGALLLPLYDSINNF